MFLLYLVIGLFLYFVIGALWNWLKQDIFEKPISPHGEILEQYNYYDPLYDDEFYTPIPKVKPSTTLDNSWIKEGF